MKTFVLSLNQASGTGSGIQKGGRGRGKEALSWWVTFIPASPPVRSVRLSRTRALAVPAWAPSLVHDTRRNNIRERHATDLRIAGAPSLSRSHMAAHSMGSCRRTRRATDASSAEAGGGGGVGAMGPGCPTLCVNPESSRRTAAGRTAAAADGEWAAERPKESCATLGGGCGGKGPAI